MPKQTKQKPAAKRGLAAMSQEKRREIASMGGRAVAKEKRAFVTNDGLASRAGAAGGKARKDKTK